MEAGTRNAGPRGKRAGRVILAAVVVACGSFAAPPLLDVLDPGVFDYALGPDGCGGWVECGNDAFGSYQAVRDAAMFATLAGLVVFVAYVSVRRPAGA